MVPKCAGIIKERVLYAEIRYESQIIFEGACISMIINCKSTFEVKLSLRKKFRCSVISLKK